MSELDINSIQSPADAEKLVNSLTPDQVREAANGNWGALQKEELKPEVATEPVEQAAPEADAKPAAEEEAKPEGEAEAEVVDPYLTPEEYAAATPKARAMHDMLEQTITQIQELEQKSIPDDVRSALADPVVAARLRMLKEGVLDVPPVPVEAVLTPELINGVLDAMADDDVTANDLERVVADKLRAAVELAISESAARTKAQMEIEYAQREALAQERAWAEAAFPAFAEKVPEWRSDKPIMIEGQNGGFVVNPEHPARGFAEWMAQSLATGELTTKAVRTYGFAGVHQLWKTQQAGGVGQYLSQVKARSRDEILLGLKQARQAAIKPVTAPTLPVEGKSAGTAPKTVHGVDIERARVDRAYAENAAMNLRDARKLDEVIAAIRAR